MVHLGKLSCTAGAQRFCFGRHCRSETRFWEPDLTRWSTAGKRKPSPKQRIQPFRKGLQVSGLFSALQLPKATPPLGRRLNSLHTTSCCFHLAFLFPLKSLLPPTVLNVLHFYHHYLRMGHHAGTRAHTCLRTYIHTLIQACLQLVHSDSLTVLGAQFLRKAGAALTWGSLRLQGGQCPGPYAKGILPFTLPREFRVRGLQAPLLQSTGWPVTQQEAARTLGLIVT